MSTVKHRNHGMKIVFNIAAILVISVSWLLTFSMSMNHSNGSAISHAKKHVPHSPTEGMEDFVNGDAKLDGRRGGKSSNGARA